MSFDDIDAGIINIDYSAVHVGERTNLAIGDRVITPFLAGLDFPIPVGEHYYSLRMTYGRAFERMHVSRIRPDWRAGADDTIDESSMNVFELDEYQKFIAFLYLLAKVMPNEC